MNNMLRIDTGATYIWDAATIDTESFLKLTMDEEITLPDDIAERWAGERIDELEEFITERTGRPYRMVSDDNVFNNENDFDSVFIWKVFMPEDEVAADWVWSNDVYIVIEVHLGGDVRGNYGATRLFRVDSPGDSGFLDWMVGWDVRDASTGERRETMSERASIGYASNPTSELESMLDGSGDIEWVEDEGAFRALDEDGNVVYVSPYTYK